MDSQNMTFDLIYPDINTKWEIFWRVSRDNLQHPGPWHNGLEGLNSGVVCCPNQHLNHLDRYIISADGKISPQFKCSQCNYTAFVQLGRYRLVNASWADKQTGKFNLCWDERWEGP